MSLCFPNGNLGKTGIFKQLNSSSCRSLFNFDVKDETGIARSDFLFCKSIGTDGEVVEGSFFSVFTDGRLIFQLPTGDFKLSRDNDFTDPGILKLYTFFGFGDNDFQVWLSKINSISLFVIIIKTLNFLKLLLKVLINLYKLQKFYKI